MTAPAWARNVAAVSLGEHWRRRLASEIWRTIPTDKTNANDNDAETFFSGAASL